MSTAERSSTSDTLPVQLRRELIIAETVNSQSPLWTVKDPVSNRYFQFRQEEFFVLQSLNGHCSISEMQERFHLSFAPLKLGTEQIISFVQQLISQGLVLVNSYGHSSLLITQQQRQQTLHRRQVLSNPLAIRFRGIDPDQLLTACRPFVSWIFSVPFLIGAFSLWAWSASIVFAEWEQMLRELPRLDQFFATGNVFLVMLTIAGIKILHELGHGFACKRFGGNCHELGVMLLAFTPCLYCNVSDAWLLKNRWHRMAISAAGIYVELIIAGLCVLIWNWTVPGVIHQLALYVVIISSVNTIFLNGNPLLRYDGYYIFSDLTGIANLKSRSLALVNSWWKSIFLGVESADPLRGHRHSKLFLGLYGLVSGIYLWFVIGAILCMLYHASKPYELQPLVVLFGLFLIGTQVTTQFKRVTQSVLQANQQGLLNRPRFVLSSLTALLAVVGLLLLPIPRRVKAPCIIESANTQIVYATAPGIVHFEQLEIGKRVNAGDVLAVQQNRELELEVLELNGLAEQYQKRIDLLKTRQTTDASAAAEIPTATARLLDLQQQLQNKQTELARLTLTAPQSGIVVPIDNPSPTGNSPIELRIEDSFAATRNESAWLNVSDPLCEIADDQHFEASLFVSQAEIPLLRIGELVSLTTVQSGRKELIGTIAELSTEPVSELPVTLLNLHKIQYMLTPDGTPTPLTPLHEVRVKLNDSQRNLILQQPGHATIRLPSEKLLSALLRMLRRTFTFEL